MLTVDRALPSEACAGKPSLSGEPDLAEIGGSSQSGCGRNRPTSHITPSEGVRPRLIGSGRVFLGERQPELLLVLDEAGQFRAVEWLELRAGFLKSLLQQRIVEDLAQAVS